MKKIILATVLAACAASGAMAASPRVELTMMGLPNATPIDLGPSKSDTIEGCVINIRDKSKLALFKDIIDDLLWTDNATATYGPVKNVDDGVKFRVTASDGSKALFVLSCTQ